MIEAKRYPDGDLLIPFARHEGDMILDGFERVKRGTSKWESWTKALRGQKIEFIAERPTGQELFDSLSKTEQDEMLGAEAAQKVRDGEATLADFVETDGNFIRQKPASDL